MSKEEAKKVRYSTEVERSLRQFLKLETGLGNKSAFVNSPAWCKCGRLNSEGDAHAAICPHNKPPSKP